MAATSRLLKSLVTAALLAAVFFAFFNFQAISDWFRLRNYTPPVAVKAFTVADDMTPYSVHIFYVNHPQLETNVTTFRQHCAIAEQTIVLGCYRGNEQGIEIYDVQDARLNGVQQVTAAHEMLHAAYDRLNQKDKDSVDAMLQDFYANQLTDQRIKDTINAYKKTEPNDVVNEMHSVFGTEVPNLPAPLEAYYKKYFTDRSQVTAFAAGYEDEFISRKNQIDADDQQLSSMKIQISAEEADLQAQLDALQAERGSVENSGSQATINAYNARISAYNNGVRKLQRDIDAYNTLVEERNSIATELKSLQSSIDTRLTTQSAQ
jgi:hypothetical protein